MHKESFLHEGKSPVNKAMFGIRILYQIGLIVFATVSLIMAILAYSELKAHSNAMNDFIDNWSLKPLVDIQVTKEDYCPKGFENLVERDWPGTNVGCYCNQFSQKHRGLHVGSCTQNQTEDRCTSVTSLRPRPMTKFYAYNICGKRQGDNFVHAERPNEAGQCPSGYNKCINGTTTNNVICTTENCPITDFKVVGARDPMPSGYTSLELSDGNKIAFTNSSDNLPVVRFRLTEEKVCADKTQYAKSNGRPLYKLIRTSSYSSCSNKIGGTYTDDRYKYIGDIIEKLLYDDNDITPFTKRYLPKYPHEQATQYYWNLYQNSYYKWDLSCERDKGYSREYMVDLMIKAIDVGDKQLDLMIICIINSIICSLILGGVAIYLSIAKWKNPGFQAKMRVCLIIFAIASTLIQWLFFILKIVFFVQCNNIINNYQDSIVLMNEANCSDEMANTFMQSYGDSLLSSKGKNNTGLTFAIVSVVTSFVFVTFNVILYLVKLMKLR